MLFLIPVAAATGLGIGWWGATSTAEAAKTDVVIETGTVNQTNVNTTTLLVLGVVVAISIFALNKHKSS